MRHVVVIVAVLFVSPLHAGDLESIKTQLASKKPTERIDGCKAAEKLGKEAAPVARTLCTLMMSSSTPLARAASDALKSVRNDLHGPVTIIILDDDGRNVGGAGGARPGGGAAPDGGTKYDQAIATLRAMKSEGNPAIPVLVAAAKKEANSSVGVTRTGGLTAGGISIKSDNRIRSIISALKEIDVGDETILPALQLCATVKNGGGREVAVEALGFYGEKRPDSRKKLTTFLMNYLADSQLRRAAVDSLARFGPDAKAALPALKQLKFDKDAGMRGAAEKAIVAIEQ